MKRIVFTILLVAALLPAAAQRVRFAAVTDPHVGREGAGDQLREAFRSIDTDTQPAFVLLLGDISDNGEPAGYAEAAEILAGLQTPYFITTGNHDAKLPERYERFRQAFGRGSFTFDAEGLRFVGLPTGPSEPNRHATLAEEDTALLAAACRDSLPVVVAAHHTPDLIAHREEDFSGVDGSRIVLWLAGHIHLNGLQETEPGPSVVNVSTLDHGRYNLIEIDGDTLRVSTVTPRTGTRECWCERILR